MSGDVVEEENEIPRTSDGQTVPHRPSLGISDHQRDKSRDES